MEVISFLSGCLIWIPITIMVISLVHWLVAGEVDVISGLAGIWFCIWLGFVALKPPDPVYSPLVFVVAIATCIAYPFVRQGMIHREHRKIEVTELKRAYDSLAQRRDNPIAMFRIATQLHTLGFPGHALKIAESALSRMPMATFRHEHMKVKSWQAVRIDPNHFSPLPCPDCGAANDPGNVFCQQCQKPFLLNRLRGGFFRGGNGKKVLAIWGALVTLCLVLPLTSSLPPLVAIAAIVVSFALAAAALFVAFKPLVDA